MKLIESLNRTVKIALDDGSAASVEEALARFAGFHIQIVVGEEVRCSLALQAFLQTVLNAAPRTFQGELTIAGSLDFEFQSGWHKAQSLIAVAKNYGFRTSSVDLSRTTIVVGQSQALLSFTDFALNVQCTANGFTLSPDSCEQSSPNSSEIAGVAAAGAALNECFQFLYFKKPWAGQRLIEYDFPFSLQHMAIPKAIRIIGLGHLGQAVVWTMGFVPGLAGSEVETLLQDYDKVSISSLSTGLLTDSNSVGRNKVEVVKSAMNSISLKSSTSVTRVELEQDVSIQESVCLVAVDDFYFRKKLDRLKCARVVEAGIGDGVEGFTKFQVHLFPGKRLASDIWTGISEKASKPVKLSTPAYQKLLTESLDECGTTQLAGRSIATPFIGAFAGAHLLALSLGGNSNELDTVAIDVNCLG